MKPADLTLAHEWVRKALTSVVNVRGFEKPDVHERAALDMVVSSLDDARRVIEALRKDAGGKPNDTARALRLIRAMQEGAR